MKRGRNHPETSPTTTTTTLAARTIPTVRDIINVNFEELARAHVPFRSVWESHHRHLGDEAVPPALSAAILKVHFQLSVQQNHWDAERRLCPPIPNRYFYVRWILDELLATVQTSGCFATSSPHGDQATIVTSLPNAGLDIGTGSIAIYCLLVAATTSCHFTMYGSDIDQEALQMAERILHDNPMVQQRIQLLLVEPTTRQQQQQQQQQQTAMNVGDNDTAMADELSSSTSGSIVGPLRQSLRHIPNTTPLAFCMTNPPFFDDATETDDDTLRTPMTHHEGYYPGGEGAFLLDIVVDSLSLFVGSNNDTSCPKPPLWLTCMCGKKTTVRYIQNVLTQLLGISHVCATEFGPGTLTRWFLGWTYQRPVLRSRLCHQTTWNFVVSGVRAQDVSTRLMEYCASFRGGNGLTWEAQTDAGMCILVERSTSSWSGDDSLPEPLRHLIGQHPTLRESLVPAHVALECRLSSDCSQYVANTRVDIIAYAHTLQGKKTAQVIQAQLDGELNRTNRRWRRKLQRMEPDNSNTSNMTTT